MEEFDGVLRAVIREAEESHTLESLTPNQMFRRMAEIAAVPPETFEAGRQRLKDRARQIICERQESPSTSTTTTSSPAAPQKRSLRRTSKATLVKVIRLCRLSPSIYKGLDKKNESAYVKGLREEVIKELLKKKVVDCERMPSVKEAKEWARNYEIQQELEGLGAKNNPTRKRGGRK